MPDRRNNPRLSVIRLIALSAALLAAAPIFLATADTSTPDAAEVPTPMSQATTDDVSFSLVAIDTTRDSAAGITVRVENQGALPVRLEAQVIELTVNTANGESATRSLTSTAPSLPCAISPGAALTIALSFDLEPGDRAISVSIGLVEINRSGAMVIFPLSPGAGASAIGGSGMAGGVSTPAPHAMTSNPSATPGASPEAEACSK